MNQLKLLVALLILILQNQNIEACDLCSCYIGTQPNYNMNQVSLRYRISGSTGWHQHVINHSENVSHEHGLNYGRSKEIFNSFELFLRHYIQSKWQVIVNIPFASNVGYSGNTRTESVMGLKDPVALARYQVFASMTTDTNLIKHRLFAGSGLRLPFGSYNFMKDKFKGLDPTFMPGAGALGLMLSATYIINIKNIGWQTDALYAINSKNRIGYRYADELSLTSNINYPIAATNMNIVPSIGVYMEQSNQDIWYDRTIPNTGGETYFSNWSLLINKDKFSVNFITQILIKENRNGSQGNQMNRFMAAVSYNF
ncbi:MAG: hypothetical protein MRY83_07905 [Flavobacteriales bacterium]|nr:hypothetical protein [Flavobacteriales bacterium]